MNIPLLDQIDIQILQHRDVHFGGNFAIMIDYYENEGVGVNEEFEIERIRELHQIQEALGENLSAISLPLPEVEAIERAKKRYFQLRDLYETEAKLSKLIGDLILSEEEYPEKEIQAIVKEGDQMVPLLLFIIQSTDLYDPLLPGYGRAPLLSALCLKEMKRKEAIAPLFSAIGTMTDDFDFEEAALSALLATPEESKSFLINQLSKEPLSLDNEKAAYLLSQFDPDPVVQAAAKSLLPRIAPTSSLAAYLALLAEL